MHSVLDTLRACRTAYNKAYSMQHIQFSSCTVNSTQHKLNKASTLYSTEHKTSAEYSIKYAM